MEKIKIDIVIPAIPLEVDLEELQTIIAKYPDNLKTSIELYKILIKKLNYIIELDDAAIEEPYVTCITDKDGEIIYEY